MGRSSKIHGEAMGLSARRHAELMEQFARVGTVKAYAHGTALFRRHGVITGALANIPGMLPEGRVLMVQRSRGVPPDARDSWRCRIMGGEVRGSVVVIPSHATGESHLSFIVDPSTDKHVAHARRSCALRVFYPVLPTPWGLEHNAWRWYIPWWRRSGVCIEQTLLQWELYVGGGFRPSVHRPGAAGLCYQPERIVCGLE